MVEPIDNQPNTLGFVPIEAVKSHHCVARLPTLVSRVNTASAGSSRHCKGTHLHRVLALYIPFGLAFATLGSKLLSLIGQLAAPKSTVFNAFLASCDRWVQATRG